MDHRRVAAYASKQGGVVTTAQFEACGLTRAGVWHRVRAGRLFPVRRGAFTLSPHQDEATRWWAAVLTTDPDDAALSHWSAARAHGIWKPRPTTVHVIVPRLGGRRAAGLTVHTTRTMARADVVLIDGLRTTSPARTVLDIAPRTEDQVVRALIREAEFRGLLAAGEMLRAVEAHPFHPGVARVGRVDPGTSEAALRQTPIEDELAALIQGLPLPDPVPQLPVRGVSGARYVLDFAWEHLGLAAEADGRSAHARSCALDDDRFRDNDLAAMGWLTLRFTRSQLGPGAADARRQLLATAMGRGWAPGEDDRPPRAVPAGPPGRSTARR